MYAEVAGGYQQDSYTVPHLIESIREEDESISVGAAMALGKDR